MARTPSTPVSLVMRYRMAEKRMTPESVAAKAGVSLRTYHRALNGEAKRPSYDRIGDALELPPAFLWHVATSDLTRLRENKDAPAEIRRVALAELRRAAAITTRST